MDKVVIRRKSKADHGAIRRIARRLHRWFTPKGRAMIRVDLRFQRGYVARLHGRVVGFITFVVSQGAGKIGWLGVAPRLQRRGVGRRLVDAVRRELRRGGVRRLQVSTLGDAVHYEPYARTRAFYRAVGFTELRRIAHPENPECEEELVMHVATETAARMPASRKRRQQRVTLVCAAARQAPASRPSGRSTRAVRQG